VVLNPNLELDLLRHREELVHLDSEMANGACKFGVPEQQLYGSQLASLMADLRRLRSA
jgi:hypothetical protein